MYLCYEIFTFIRYCESHMQRSENYKPFWYVFVDRILIQCYNILFLLMINCTKIIQSNLQNNTQGILISFNLVFR